MWVFIKEHAKTGGVLVLILLACILPFIDVYRYIDFCKHKNQVTIESTICQGLTEETDGKDYLNFLMKVSFGKYEVNRLDVHTLVFKGDKFVGYIESSFSGASSHYENSHNGEKFEANSDQNLKFRISHTRGDSWSGDELFEELYYEDLEDYTFVSNIICVSFSDGTTVGRYGDYYYNEDGQIHYEEYNDLNGLYELLNLWLNLLLGNNII